MQDVAGCQYFRRFLEDAAQSSLVQFDAWIEFDLFRLTAAENPNTFYNTAANLYHKYPADCIILYLD